jgi:ribonuclease D
LSEWIDRTAALSELVPHAPLTFGLDTEFMRISTFYPRLALIQVVLGERIALIDPVAKDIDLGALGEVLADPARLVIMHSASEDLEALATRFVQGVGQLFDTQIAAAFAGLGAGAGYQKLVREMLGIDLPKAETRSDWLRRPLSPQQIEYAAHDVIHLPALHEALAARVAERGYTAWLVEDCARMIERARRREADPEPQTALRGAADWPLPRQALLRRVLRWREATARRTDTPRPWILDDATALDLSSRPPKSDSDLAERTKGLRGLRSALRAELADVLAQPLEDDDLKLEPIPRAPSLREKPALAALRDAAAARARELDLPDGLLAARRHIESLLVTQRWPAALEGWRRDVLHDALMPLLP